MTFLRANILKEIFKTEGAFYKIQLGNKRYPCRGLAKISRRGVRAERAEAVFVLLNPGSCEPADPNYEYPDFQKDIMKIPLMPAKPDATQYQLMRLMERQKWNMVYVINLSDLCSGNVKVFESHLKEFIDKDYHDHSIFSQDRISTIPTLLSESTVLIAGWGQNKVIKEIARHAFSKLSQMTDVKGVKHAEEPYFYHPYPMIKEKCMKWLDDMSQVLAESKNEKVNL